MSYELRAENGLTVLGIFTTASNASPQAIGDLWRRFHAMGDQNVIAVRQDDAVYCVYCEYEGDWTKSFTVVIGCAVARDASIPEGMKKIDVQAGTFAVLQALGELPKGVFEAWDEVWKTPLDRRYQADFDCYKKDGAVSVHVGVR